MKNLLRMIRLYLTRAKRERDAQTQRFDRMFFYLSKCRSHIDIQNFDALCDRDLTAKDCNSAKYDRLMLRRFDLEKRISVSEIELQNTRIKEGDFIIRKFGL